MGKSGSKEEAPGRQSEAKAWQVRSARFKAYTSQLDQLREFTDSTSDETIARLMCVDQTGNKQGAGVKGLVSKKKIRFQNEFFNLDLAYVTERTLAMGFPAVGVQKAYRNSRDDVISFLDTYHPTHYKIYNLCAEPDRFYTNKSFPGVPVEFFPIEDHQATSLLKLFLFCLDAYYYMRESAANVIAVHCKAGKGRTGMLISSFLLFTGLKSSADEALVYYGRRRAHDGVGVSIPSQVRSVEYFDAFLVEEFGEQYRSCIDFILSRQESTARVIKMRNAKAFRMVSLRLFPSLREVQERATVRVKLLEKDDCQVVEFVPKGLETGVCDYLPSEEVVVSGDYCLEFRSRSLKFRLWMNAYFSETDLELEKVFTANGETLFSSVFYFHKERPPLAPPNNWPRKSLTDFDHQSGLLSKQPDLSLKVVYSGSKFKAAPKS